MKFWQMLGRFSLGGAAYVGLELLWRGRSHGSMFVAGGVCFLMLDRLGRTGLPLWAKTTLGALSITGVELVTGLLVNRGFTVWDYRTLPCNFLGQICLPYSLLWMPVSLLGLTLASLLDREDTQS